LGKNHHIKTVKEVFKNGNNWIEVDFDCEHSRDAAMDRIKRKEGEWLKLIPEETKNKTYNIAQQEEQNTTRRKEESMRRKETKKSIETEELNVKNRKRKEEEYKNTGQAKAEAKITRSIRTEENVKTGNYLTIWDLPPNINIEEVEHMCRNIKDAKIERIKRSKYKALAIVYTKNLREENIPWALPIGTHKLARVSKGNEDYNLRDQHSLYTTKLLELPGNASEVLLLRCLRKRGAKSVYIPTNRNGNQRRSAIVTFALEKEMKTAQTKPIRFNNHLLFWQDHKKGKDKYINKCENVNVKYINTEDITEDSEVEVYRSSNSNKQEKKKDKHHNSYKRKESETEKTNPQVHNILQKILERLERLETQQGQAVLANHS
jgi:hypothetical protein